MTLYEWHLVLDDEFGEPLWGTEERDEMIAAGVLVPVEPDYTLTVDEDGDFRFDGSFRHKNLMMADPGEYVVVLVGGETP